MKKQIKLFALVLTIALVLGVFTVGAVAATEYDNASDIANLTAGENFLIYSNFSNAVAKEYTGTASIPTNNGSTLQMKLTDDDSANRVLVIGTNDGGVANNYLQIKNDTAAASAKSFYLNMDKGAPNLTNEEDQNAFLNSGNTFRDLQYHVMDFDVFFPEGKISITPSVQFYIRGYGSDGVMYDGRATGSATVKLGYDTNSYGVQFKEVDGNIVLLTPRNMANGNTTFPTVTDTTVITTSNMHVLEKDQWSHVTIIMESVINDRGTPAESDDGIDFIFYTALNGKVVSSFRMNAPSYATYGSAWMQGDMTGVFLRMIRVNAPKIGAGDKMNIDNFAVRTYDRDEYNGNLGEVLEGIVPATNKTATAATWKMDCKGADLANWDRNVYNPATMPFGTAVAKIGDVEYTNLAAAIKAAQDGDTITMLADSVMNVTVGKELTINLNGNTIGEVTAATGYEVVTDGSTVTVQIPAVPGVAKIGETEYQSLADAIAAAQPGDTITMLQSSNESVVIGKELTIVYNGFTVTGISYENECCQSVSTTAEQLVVKKAVFEITKTDNTTYLSDDTFYNVINGITNAPRKYVKLLQDVSYSATKTIYVKRTFTLDLNGHTLNIVQALPSTSEFTIQQISATSYPTWTITNGTINVSNTNASNKGATYPVFNMNTGPATLNLTNLTVNSGPLIYNHSNKSEPKVNLQNSVFNLNQAGKVTDNVNGGLVESHANITVTATGCKIYAQSTSLLTSMHYNGGTDTSIFNSNFTFTNCDIFRDGVTDGVRNNLFFGINSYTTVTFNGCNIAGSLTPVLAEDDSTNGIPAATEANIILGEGTTLSADSTYTASAADGLFIITSSGSYVFTMSGIDAITYAIGKLVSDSGVAKIGDTEYSSLSEAIAAAGTGDIITLMANIDEAITISKEVTIAYNSFTVTGYTIAAKYCQSVATTADQLVIKSAIYEIKKSNGDISYSDAAFNSIITNASLKSVVKLLQDVDYNSTIYIQVYRNYTLDLNGHTLNITQGIPSNKTQAEFLFNTANVTFTITSSAETRGKINVTNASTYHVFRANNTGLKLVLSNVEVTSGSLIHSAVADFAVSISNSEFNVTKSGGSGFIESRNTTAFTATNSKFYLQSNALILSMAIAGATEDTFRSTFDFTNCDIYRDSMNGETRKNLFTVINKYTYVTFNGCNIAGSLEYATNSDELKNGIPAMTEENIILGEGTTLSADSTYTASFPENFDGLADSSTFTFNSSAFGISFTYTKGIVVGAKFFTITWYKEDGKTVITTQTQQFGSSGVEAPSYNPGTNNGWYITSFDGWTDLFGSSNSIDLSTYVISGNVSFYPAINATTPPKPYLKSAEYNLTLMGNIGINFYLPMTPDGINVIGVYFEDEITEIVGEEVILPNGEHRMMYVIGTVGATELTQKTVIKVKFTVTQNGNSYDLVQTATLSPYKYAASVLKSSEHTDETRVLIADMVRYSNVLSSVTSGTTVKELDDLLAIYGEYCSPVPSNNDFAEFTTSVAGLAGYIETISLEVSEYQPRWKFTFTEAMKVKDVKITLDGYYEITDENGCNYGSLTYKLNTADSTKTNGYYTSVYMENIPMYNVDRIITITVTTEDGAVHSGTYSLNSYFANMTAEPDKLAEVREFLKVFRAFGITSAGYRYADGIKQQGAPAKDFFECDHAKITNRGPSTNSLTNGLYCSDCQTYVFFYESRIRNAGNNLGENLLFSSRDAALTRAYNAYTQIYLCHSAANAAAANPENQGKKYGCYAGPYFYYLEEAKLSDHIGEITVRTDTNWAGAHFIIDDSGFGVEDKTYKTPVFAVRGPSSVTAPDGNVYSDEGTDITNLIVEKLGTKANTNVITPSTTNIGWSCGMPMLIELIDYSQTRYHREGTNASKAATHEVILVDEFGNVSRNTPIECDYFYNPTFNSVTPGSEGTDEEVIVECSFKATAYSISTAPFKLSGLDLDGNISCVFETIPNQTDIDVTEYNACRRGGIYVKSSNVTIEGIEHIMNEDDSTSTPRQAYDGFIRVVYSNNVVIKDMLVDSPLGHTTTAGSHIGSYEFAAADSVNISWINCISKDFFTADGSISGGGLFGTNRTRNSYVKNCVLNSFDSHTGAYNVTIEDSTFQVINLIGAGDIVVKNVAVYADSNYGGITLRRDYGSRWEGNIYIYGLDLRHSASYSKEYIDLIKAEYTNFDFGYTNNSATKGNYLPAKVYAENVTISSYTRTNQSYDLIAPGMIDEDLTKSTKRLGIMVAYSDSLYERYPTFSWDNHNDQTSHITEEFRIVGGDIDSLADLYLPKNGKLGNIKIYINDEEQQW